MNNDQFQQVEKTIKDRRSVSWAKMNGQLIANETVNQLLELAHWAPNHGHTEPWQFFVYSGEALKNFGKTHADLYWNHTAEDKRLEATREKLEHTVDKASHLIIAVMKRGEHIKIPQIEEISAASAAVQNILLGAAAMGISSLWSTGGMAHSNALKDHLQLLADDIVLGMIYLGYTDEPAKEGTRNAIAGKVKWM